MIMQHHSLVDMQKTSKWKNFILWIGRFLFIIALSIFCIKFYKVANQISINFHSASVLISIPFVVFLNLMIYCNTAFNWKTLLLANPAEKISLESSIYIVSFSQVAKYIPGNIFQFIGRMYLTQKQGISRNKTILSLLWDNILVTISCLSVFFVGLFFLKDYKKLYQFIPKILQEDIQHRGITISVFIILSAIIIFIFIKRIRIFILDTILTIDIRTLLKVLFFYILSQLTYGFILLLIERYFFDTHSINFLYHASAFSIAWILGTFTPGAPGGLGVREMVLILLYTPMVDEPTAMGITLVLRIVNLMAEILFFLLGYIIAKRTKIL